MICQGCLNHTRMAYGDGFCLACIVAVIFNPDGGIAATSVRLDRDGTITGLDSDGEPFTEQPS